MNPSSTIADQPAPSVPPLACEECGAIGGTTRYTGMGDFCLTCQPYREDGLYFSEEARARMANLSAPLTSRPAGGLTP